MNGAAEAALVGFMVGYGVAIAFTAAAAILIVRLRTQVRFLRERLAPWLTPMTVAVPVAGFAFLAWTAIGMGLGLAYYAMEQVAPRGGLGSPNLVYTMVIAGLALVLVAPWLVVAPALRRYLAVGVAVYIAAFAWLLPNVIAQAS
ncbi:MAG: hypothetical protein EXR43_06255 [Dehalococcoidia bacterium]|nr:hypothetical protein [Dehalococcoidia bacterium]